MSEGGTVSGDALQRAGSLYPHHGEVLGKSLAAAHGRVSAASPWAETTGEREMTLKCLPARYLGSWVPRCRLPSQFLSSQKSARVRWTHGQYAGTHACSSKVSLPSSRCTVCSGPAGRYLGTWAWPRRSLGSLERMTGTPAIVLRRALLNVSPGTFASRTRHSWFR